MEINLNHLKLATPAMFSTHEGKQIKNKMKVNWKSNLDNGTDTKNNSKTICMVAETMPQIGLW